MSEVDWDGDGAVVHRGAEKKSLVLDFSIPVDTHLPICHLIFR